MEIEKCSHYVLAFLFIFIYVYFYIAGEISTLMYIMRVIQCLFSALSRRVGAYKFPLFLLLLFGWMLE